MVPPAWHPFSMLVVTPQLCFGELPGPADYRCGRDGQSNCARGMVET